MLLTANANMAHPCPRLFQIETQGTAVRAILAHNPNPPGGIRRIGVAIGGPYMSTAAITMRDTAQIIRAMEAEFEGHANAGDAAGLTESFYAAEAQLQPPNTPPAKGSPRSATSGPHSWPRSPPAFRWRRSMWTARATWPTAPGLPVHARRGRARRQIPGGLSEGGRRLQVRRRFV